MMHPTALHHIVISSHWPHASLLSMEAERWASGAAGSGSEGRASAGSRRLHALVPAGGISSPATPPLGVPIRLCSYRPPRPCLRLHRAPHPPGPEQKGKNGQAECLRRLDKVEDQLERHGLLHGQVGRFGAFQNLAHIGGGTPMGSQAGSAHRTSSPPSLPYISWHRSRAARCTSRRGRPRVRADKDPSATGSDTGR